MARTCWSGWFILNTKVSCLINLNKKLLSCSKLQHCWNSSPSEVKLCFPTLDRASFWAILGCSQVPRKHKQYITIFKKKITDIKHFHNWHNTIHLKRMQTMQSESECRDRHLDGWRCCDRLSCSQTMQGPRCIIAARSEFCFRIWQSAKFGVQHEPNHHTSITECNPSCSHKLIFMNAPWRLSKSQSLKS